MGPLREWLDRTTESWSPPQASDTANSTPLPLLAHSVAGAARRGGRGVRHVLDGWVGGAALGFVPGSG